MFDLVEDEFPATVVNVPASGLNRRITFAEASVISSAPSSAHASAEGTPMHTAVAGRAPPAVGSCVVGTHALPVPATVKAAPVELFMYRRR